MSARTYTPSPALQPYISAFVLSETANAGAYRVLPGMGLVMGFQYSGRISYQQVGEFRPLSPAGITGLNDTFRTFSNTRNTGTLLVLFSETGAAAFFQHDMHTLFGQSLGLDDLMLRSQMDAVVEQLLEASADLERILVVERFLLSRLDPRRNDELVNRAVMLIKQAGGQLRMAGLAEQLNISQGRLEKRFRQVVGTSPKKFASLARFRQLLDEPQRGKRLLERALDAGYFDQSHFIRDLRSFTGQSPEQFFKDL